MPEIHGHQEMIELSERRLQALARDVAGAVAGAGSNSAGEDAPANGLMACQRSTARQPKGNAPSS